MNTIKRGVYEVLERHSPGMAKEWSTIEMPDDLKSISTYWKFRLGDIATEDTIEIRTHLDSTMAVDTWLMHFELVVLPVLLRNPH